MTTILSFLLATAWLPFAEVEDPIREKLDQAKAKYKNEAQGILEEIRNRLNERLRQARQQGNKAQVDDLKADIDAFELEGKPPKLVSTAEAGRRLKRLQTELVKAYRDAIREYTKKSEDGKADDLEKELADFVNPKPQQKSSTQPKKQNAGGAEGLLKPVARWSFEGDLKDSVGQVQGAIRGGAYVGNGRLHLTGQGAFFLTDPLPFDLGEKTIEVWTTITPMPGRQTSRVLVALSDNHEEDGLMIGDGGMNKWMNFSPNYSRTINNHSAGPDELAKPSELVHLAIVYDANNTITLYRNGLPYGKGYTKGSLAHFSKGTTILYLGGISSFGQQPRNFFKGTVEELRIYDRALSKEEIQLSNKLTSFP